MKSPLRVVSCLVLCLGSAADARAELRAGAAAVDVTPRQLPVLVNGGMLSHTADKVKTRLHARAIVLDDGRERLGVVVVDSCMMPRPLLDEAKSLAAQRTKIRADHMLISASHAAQRTGVDGMSGYGRGCEIRTLSAGKAGGRRSRPRRRTSNRPALAGRLATPSRSRRCGSGFAGPIASPRIRSAT